MICLHRKGVRHFAKLLFLLVILCVFVPSWQEKELATKAPRLYAFSAKD